MLQCTEPRPIIPAYMPMETPSKNRRSEGPPDRLRASTSLAAITSKSWRTVNAVPFGARYVARPNLISFPTSGTVR